jgi:hypothetical protein
MIQQDPLNKQDHERLFRALHEINLRLEEIEATITKISMMQIDDRIMTKEHDKILIRGNGTPSLQETVRSLSGSLKTYIDEARIERERRATLEKDEAERKRIEMLKWKWAIIAFGFATFPPLVWSLIVFWVRVAPVLENFKNP